MPIRRFHTKSRAGCLQCKERKTKCDEAKPGCQNCTKRKITCSFVTEKSTLIVVDSSNARIPSRFRLKDPIIHVDAPCTEEEIRLAKSYSLRGDDNDKLRLMHHYALSTCYSITDLSFVSQFLPLRDVVPALAFEYDFLLSGLMAVTSLHLAILNPSTIHTTSAIKYHTEALSQVVPHLACVSPANVEALFSFSSLIALYALGFHQTQPASDDPIGDMIEVFRLIRGIRIIVRDGVQWIQQGPFAGTMLPSPDPSVTLAPKVEAALSRLDRHNSENITDIASREAYAAALELLREAFLLATEKPSAKITALPFPIMVPDEFMEKLECRDPMAMVILANFAVVLYWIRGHIWLCGWGKEIVSAVKDTVDDELHVYLEWALRETVG